MSRNLLVLLLALSLVLSSIGIGILITDFELDGTDGNGGDNDGVEINSETVNITVCKFYDYNGNGEFDEDDGDEMLSGWDFELDVKNETSQPWEVIRSGNTSDDGCLTFEVETDEENEKGKHFRVREFLKEGWYFTGGNVTGGSAEGDADFEVEEGEVGITFWDQGEDVEIWFGNKEKEEGNITAYKFHDIDGDGYYDQGEKMLENWDFTLWNTTEEGDKDTIIDNATTNGSGAATFEDVAPGDYIVEEDLKEGWSNTTSLQQFVTIEEDDEKELWFGNRKLEGNITVYKFHDENMNGSYDKGEGMLENWTFDLWNLTDEGELDEVIENGVTDENGELIFEDIYPGEYVVEEQPKEGWENTTSQKRYVDLTYGEEAEVWFGNRELEGNITAYKFYDKDGTGEFNETAGDEMLANWTIQLLDSDQQFVMEGETDENGQVKFVGLEPGEYYVREVLNDGWKNTTSLKRYVNLTDGEEAEVWFGNRELEGSITAYKFYDENMNGSYDEGEKMLENWTFNLTVAGDGGPIDTLVTDENGSATFEQVSLGEYVVEEELKEDWVNTTPTKQIVTVEDEKEYELWFGNIPSGSIEGYKFCDYNRNRTFDDEESGLEGWTVQLYEQDEEVPLKTTTTDEDGYYRFEDVKPGDYVVEEVMRVGWYNSTSYYYEVTLEPKSEVRYDFGNYQYQDITGIKFYDFTMNGTFEPGKGDIPLNDREVQLYEGNETNGDPIKTTYTDEYGYYSFEDLEPGEYTVYQPEACCDWIRTTPQEVTVEIGIGCEDEEVNFGEYKMSKIDVHVEDGKSSLKVEIYKYDPEEGETGDLVDNGTIGPDGWYISIELEPGYYLVELGDGRSELVQLRMGEQVDFDESTTDFDSTEILAKKARHTEIK